MFPRVYSEVVVGQQINVLEIVVNTVDKPKVQLVKKMFKHVVLENGNIVTIKWMCEYLYIWHWRKWSLPQNWVKIIDFQCKDRVKS